MANASPEIAQPNETQRAETAANRFYDMADKAKAEEARYPQDERFKEEVFSGVGRETAQGNFHGAQRLLEERSGMWNDNLRGAASEVNQLDQEKRGAKPMTFEEAQKSISGYARDLEKLSKEPGGRQSDLEGAMDIDNIVADTSEPGMEGVDKALKYIEDLLQSKTNTADSILKSKGPLGEQAKGFMKDWQEKRAIRDALYQEKQKRLEQGSQAQRATKEVTEARGATTSGLENMFDQAGVPKDLPSRQELASQVGRMSPEETRLFDAALKKAGAEFGRTRDPALLQARLEGLGGKSWKREDVERRQKLEDQRKIEEIRRKMGLPEQQPAKPSGRNEEIEKSRKRIEEMVPKKEAGAPASAREEAAKPPEQEKKPVYERITDENLDQYRQQGKEVLLNGRVWKFSSITENGDVVLHGDIPVQEAIQKAERANRGEKMQHFGGLNESGVKIQGRVVSMVEFKRGGQWIVEKPPRSPQNPERQKEVDEVKLLQQRLKSGEFKKNVADGEDLLMEVLERDSDRLNKEWQDYEKSTGKK